MNQPLKNSYAFGEFRLDGAERRLLRNGVVISLAPKVFDTLLLLVQNSGHLVEKDGFMKQLWPDTFVGEDALARNISILRKALGESNDSQSFIATVPTRGYRFVGDVRKITEPEQRPVQETLTSGPSIRSDENNHEAVKTVEPLVSVSWPRRIAFLVLVLSAGSLAGFITFYLLSPPPTPLVLRAVQLTHSGKVDPWTSLVSDGSRIYFNEREGDHWNLVQTSVSGGESQVVVAPFQNTVVRDISPDHANLLIASFARRGAAMPLWIWPIQGGAPRRVGDLTVYDAAWCPNGREIIYTEDDGIYMANDDGTNARKFVPWEGRPGMFAWSPDGRLLRFTVFSTAIPGSTMWEVHPDGSLLHRLIPHWNSRPDEWGGSWTPDGKYFLFQSRHSESTDIWAIQEKGTLFHRGRGEPIRMTAGPIDFSAPLVINDGRKVFVYGTHGKAEFVRYDLKSRQFFPVLQGTPARTLGFSRDGEWVAYGAERNSTLVRMRPDGTQQLAIVSPLLEAGSPRWSPDGRSIAFEGLRPNRTSAIFLVSPDGGTPRELVPDDRNQFDPMWSPDGKLLAFTREERTSVSAAPSGSILLFNLLTNELSPLPESQGLRASSWSPDSRFVAAKSEDEHRLMLFDFQTRKWRQLAQVNLLFGLPWWSKDQKCLYYQDLLAPNEPIYCLNVSNNRQEIVVTFEQFLRGSAHRGAFIGLAPDGSLIASLARNDSDIYALDLYLP
jgi:Tol biopolymer transport system component/DNA-binding winged helix-turn-helix (wHTH) protein